MIAMLLRRTVVASAVAFAVGGVLSAPALAAPETPLTKPATAVTATTAVIHGQVNPGSGSGLVRYAFAYQVGPSCTGGERLPQPPGEVAGNHKEVSFTLAELQPSARYSFCLNVMVGGGEVPEEEAAGQSLSFMTLGARPAVDAQSTSGLTPTDTMLEAQVNPENQGAIYRFQYGLNPKLVGATSVGSGSLPPGFGDQTAGPVDIGGGLKAGTTYFYRVVATNATGTTEGPIQSFKTRVPERPLIEEESAPPAGVGSESAMLSALVNPEFQASTCTGFQYVADQPFKEHEYAGAPSAPCTPETIEAGGTGMTVTGQLTGLAANTLYHFRVQAQNASGPSTGADSTFLTLPAAPVASTGGASAVSASSATITGSVNPASSGVNSDTSYVFEYGPTDSYGSQIPLPAGDAGQGTGPVAVSAALTGLAPGTTYHYRIAASNNNSNPPSAPQFTYGEDRSFQTIPTPPSLTNGSLAGVSATSVTVLATLDTHGLPTRYELQLGTTPATLQARAAGSSASPAATQVSLGVEGLAPATLYYYRLLAANSNGSAPTPPEGTFTTPAGTGAAEGLNQPPTPPLITTPTITFPPEQSGPDRGPSRPTTAQLLAKALHACRHKHRHARLRCEHQAHHRYPTNRHGSVRASV